MANIIIKGTILDTEAKHLVRFADIEFVSPDDPNERFTGTTNEDGQIQRLIDQPPTSPTPAPWADLELPRAGKWILGPDTETYSTHYFFKPRIVDVKEDGNLAQVEVVGDNLNNNRQLITYIASTFLAGRDIFLADVNQIPSGRLTDDLIKARAQNALAIANAGFEAVLRPTPNPFELSGTQEEEIQRYGLGDVYEEAREAHYRAEKTARAYKQALASAHSKAGTRSVEDEILQRLCELLKSKTGQDKVGGLNEIFDNIPCALCRSRYANDPARLQTCLCCAPCQL